LRPAFSSTIFIGTPWLFAAVPIAYLVMVAAMQIVRPLLG